MIRLKSEKILIASSLILIFALSIFAQNNNRFDEPISDEQYEFLLQKKALIEKEVANDKNEWSGTYSQGDHHPTIFMWSAGQGFLTWGSHHTFFPSRINFGKAEFANNRLIIKPEIAKDNLHFQYIPTELVPVKWGEQHFLIGSDDLINFAYAVHSGAESQIVSFFAKSADYEKSRTGLPNLPKEYEKILTMKAIKPKVTAMKKKDDALLDAELTLNRGRADMLIEGMLFYYVNSSGSLTIMITDLNESSSKATVVGYSQRAEKQIEPKIGIKFTSKAPDDFYGY